MFRGASEDRLYTLKFKLLHCLLEDIGRFRALKLKKSSAFDRPNVHIKNITKLHGTALFWSEEHCVLNGETQGNRCMCRLCRRVGAVVI